MMGCAIGYWQGDILKLVDDIAVLKPAMFIGVPRVFERIYTRITDQVRSACETLEAVAQWLAEHLVLHMVYFGIEPSASNGLAVKTAVMQRLAELLVSPKQLIKNRKSRARPVLFSCWAVLVQGGRNSESVWLPALLRVNLVLHVADC
eukprot:scaffold67152_cov20-Tisochrysis_lutea.AAC.1